ncbi:hypothetical protein, partial [Kluyvera sp. Awk 3]|uniref:hypothetical protein n=1 Tax=Kluyvera sp. Awk 3 TaxID=2963956 RepID=UPI0023020F56
MAFRAEETAVANLERAYRYLLPEGASLSERALVMDVLEEIVEEFGPVVEGYPAWHPFLLEMDRSKWSPPTPQGMGSFKKLDHTIYFRNAILTCPYSHAVDELIDTIRNLKHKDASISIDRLDEVVLYHTEAVPLLIKCDWHYPAEYDGTISAKAAIGLMLEYEVPNWRIADYCESWESMRGQLLGYPHGARSSLFVNQQTGQKMKNLWNQLIKTGCLG